MNDYIYFQSGSLWVSEISGKQLLLYIIQAETQIMVQITEVENIDTDTYWNNKENNYNNENSMKNQPSHSKLSRTFVRTEQVALGDSEGLG